MKQRACHLGFRFQDSGLTKRGSHVSLEIAWVCRVSGFKFQVCCSPPVAPFGLPLAGCLLRAPARTHSGCAPHRLSRSARFAPLGSGAPRHRTARARSEVLRVCGARFHPRPHRYGFASRSVAGVARTLTLRQFPDPFLPFYFLFFNFPPPPTSPERRLALRPAGS
jgi:hypothetical protein